MTFEEPGWPLIDDFFRDLADGRSDATLRRYARVHHRLVSFLDTADMTLGLGDSGARLLEAEREFHDGGAFWTLYGADELVACLPSFLHETWLPAGVGEARTQVSIVSRLLAHLLRQRLLGGPGTSDAVLEVSAAIGRATRGIEDRSRAAVEEDHQLPIRFRQQPGPQW